MSQLSNEEQFKIINDLEMEMMADMYSRLSNACQKKCIPSKYKEPDLSKGEAVCIDRCVAKYFDVYEKVGKKLNNMSMQEQEATKNPQTPTLPK